MRLRLHDDPKGDDTRAAHFTAKDPESLRRGVARAWSQIQLLRRERKEPETLVAFVHVQMPRRKEWTWVTLDGAQNLFRVVSLRPGLLAREESETLWRAAVICATQVEEHADAIAALAGSLGDKVRGEVKRRPGPQGVREAATKLQRAGWGHAAIAKKLGVSRQRIHQLFASRA